MVKIVHVLVPEVEAALRDVLSALGGAVTKQDRNGGSQMISLGEVLSHDRIPGEAPGEAVKVHDSFWPVADGRFRTLSGPMTFPLPAIQLVESGRSLSGIA